MSRGYLKITESGKCYLEVPKIVTLSNFAYLERRPPSNSDFISATATRSKNSQKPVTYHKSLSFSAFFRKLCYDFVAVSTLYTHLYLLQYFFKNYICSSNKYTKQIRHGTIKALNKIIRRWSLAFKNPNLSKFDHKRTKA